jgi:hypothetical protein
VLLLNIDSGSSKIGNLLHSVIFNRDNTTEAVNITHDYYEYNYTIATSYETQPPINYHTDVTIADTVQRLLSDVDAATPLAGDAAN